jgi:hypothetical protein
MFGLRRAELTKNPLDGIQIGLYQNRQVCIVWSVRMEAMTGAMAAAGCGHHPESTVAPPHNELEERPMYYEVTSQCTQALKNVEGWLDKAEQYSVSKRFDVLVLLTSRLAPDMQNFIYQVQSACDYVKAAAGWLSGQTPPKHEDTERTVGDLRVRIQKTVAFAESVKAAQYAKAGEREVSLSWAPGKVIRGEDYLLQVAVPNIFFHLTMAYAILRHNGVDIGKSDFLGEVRFDDAFIGI